MASGAVLGRSAGIMDCGSTPYEAAGLLSSRGTGLICGPICRPASCGESRPLCTFAARAAVAAVAAPLLAIGKGGASRRKAAGSSSE